MLESSSVRGYKQEKSIYVNVLCSSNQLYTVIMLMTHCLFENEEHADLFLKHINNYHGSIKFTVDKEANTSLPFLDILIHKDTTKFSTSLYKKSTFMGLYTDFSTLSPHKYKVNLISVLIFCAFTICSSYINFHNITKL